MKLRKYKKDIYHKKSKEEGFRARSAWKLIQINERFNIFTNVNSVLDLGAAPGSWIQVLLRLIGDRNPLVFGVDYKHIGPIEGAKISSVNVYSEKIEEEIEDYFKNGIDCILSDMAPKISGNKSLDNGKMIDLVNRAYELVRKYMNKGGNFVIKVFQYPEINALLKEFKRYFQMVKLHKPKASRIGSRELYIIAKNYKK
ncbi:MAG: SAM-dependent methyltransferase [Promethearchaeota archaeon]